MYIFFSFASLTKHYGIFPPEQLQMFQGFANYTMFCVKNTYKKGFASFGY